MAKYRRSRVAPPPPTERLFDGGPFAGPTADEIEAARSPRGGWSSATLASWGVPWPPPKGWKKALELAAEHRAALERDDG